MSMMHESDVCTSTLQPRGDDRCSGAILSHPWAMFVPMNDLNRVTPSSSWTCKFVQHAASVMRQVCAAT
jgi:hypothetical protein